jgi:hypothetical protein
VKHDEAADPPDVRLLGAQAIVLDPDTFPDLIEEAGRGRRRVCGKRWCVSHDRLLAKQGIAIAGEGLYGERAVLYIRHASGI